MKDLFPFLHDVMGPQLEVFITFASVHLLSVLSPGPDFALVVRNSVTRSRKVGLYCVLGMCTGVILHSTYCILGLGTLIAEVPAALNVVRAIGASYLTYLGIKSLMSKPHKANIEGGHHRPDIPFKEAYLQGLICNISNPNAAMFYISMYAVLLPQNPPAGLKLALASWFVFISLVWFSFVSFALTSRHAQRVFSDYAHWIERFTGLFLMCLASALVYQIWQG